MKAADLFDSFFKAKAKKMNFVMMMLADCIGNATVENDEALFTYIKSFGEICEVRAVAYKDLANKPTS